MYYCKNVPFLHSISAKAITILFNNNSLLYLASMLYFHYIKHLDINIGWHRTGVAKFPSNDGCVCKS